MRRRGRSSDSGLPPPPPSQPGGQWSRRRSDSPHSGGTVPDSHRVPLPRAVSATLSWGPCRSPGRSVWLPVVVWAAVIFALSSIPSLGTGLGAVGLGAAEGRAHDRVRDPRGAARPRARARAAGARRGVAYAVTDEIHQTSSRAATGAARRRDRRVGVASGSSSAVSSRRRQHRTVRHGDGRSAKRRWRSTSTACSGTRGRCGGTGSRTPRGATGRSRRSTRRACRRIGPPPRSSTAGPKRGSATGARARALREDRAPVYLRPDAEVSARAAEPRRGRAPTRRLHRRAGRPRPRRLAQLGVERRIEALETGRTPWSVSGTVRAGSSRRAGTVGSRS